MRFSTPLASPLAALALAFGLMVPTVQAAPPTYYKAPAAKTDSKIYAGSGCHVDTRDFDQTDVEATTSILKNNGGVTLTATCPIVRDTNGGIDFAELHVLGEVACTIYSRTAQNFVTATFFPDLDFIGFFPNGKRFTFFVGDRFGFVPVGDSLALNCTLQPGGAIIQYRIDEIE